MATKPVTDLTVLTSNIHVGPPAQVTLDEAAKCLNKTIAYVEANPDIAEIYIGTLLDLLQLLRDQQTYLNDVKPLVNVADTTTLSQSALHSKCWTEDSHPKSRHSACRDEEADHSSNDEPIETAASDMSTSGTPTGHDHLDTTVTFGVEIDDVDTTHTSLKIEHLNTINLTTVFEKPQDQVDRSTSSSDSPQRDLDGDVHGKDRKSVRSLACYLCSKSYVFPGHLRYHMDKEHHGEMPYKCSACGTLFTCFIDIDTHMKEIHMCNTPGNHITAGNSPDSTELYCKPDPILAVETKPNTQRSKKKKKDDPKEINRKKKKNALRMRMYRLRLKKEANLGRDQSSCEYDKNRISSEGDEPMNVKSSHECMTAEVNPDLLHNVMLTNLLNKVIEASDSDTDQETKTSNLCYLCDKSYAYTECLKTHMKTVHGLTAPYNCMSCEKVFISFDRFNRHVQRHNASSECTICNKHFSHMEHLKEHMKKHIDPKPYSCQYCDKRFAKKAIMAKHELIHSGKRPHQCKICDKRFTQHCGLKYHMMLHTGDRRFICSICGKGFIIAPKLKMHMRTHTGEKPHACSMCDRAFSDPGKLRLHFRLHTGERPFVCAVCGKTFVDATALRHHNMLHTGEKPYHCDTCDRYFRKLYTLKVHRKTHNIA